MEKSPGRFSRSSPSIFDKAWDRISTGDQPDFLALLEEIELQLGLKAGFLSLDELIIHNLQLLCNQMPHPRSKLDMLNMTVRALSDIKIMDVRRNKLYGDFSDNYAVYKDNLDNIMYRMEKLDEDDRAKLDVESAYSVHTKYESDYDETASLMACDSNLAERSPSMLEYPVDDVEDTFKLHKVLEDLRARHVTISMGFHDIDTKLAHIKEQNGKDLEFLDKLTANSELIRDRMHDMRTELNELTSALLVLKESTDSEPVSLAEKDSKIIAENSESVNNHCIRADKVSVTLLGSLLDLTKDPMAENTTSIQIMESNHGKEENNTNHKIEESREEKKPPAAKELSVDTEIIRKSDHEVTILVKRKNGKQETAEQNNKGKNKETSDIKKHGTEIMQANSFKLSIPVLILLMAVIAYWKY